jgi:hypothetical protein
MTAAATVTDIERKATAQLRDTLRAARKAHREAVTIAKVALAKAEAEAYHTFSEQTGTTA